MNKTALILLVLVLLMLLLVGCPAKKDEPSHVTLIMLEPEGNGSVIPEVGDHDYLEDEIAEIEANPDEGWRFVKWEVNGAEYSTNAETTVTMDGDKTVTAFFEQIEYTLTMLEPEGNGSVVPVVGNHTYPQGTVVNLIAEPEEEWEFEKWEVGGVHYSDEETTTLNMDSDKSVQAFFEFAGEVPQYTIRVKVSPDNSGEVQINGRGFKAEDEDIVDAGQQVQIIAQGFEGWEFLGWFEVEEAAPQLIEEPFCSEPSCSFFADKDLSLEARFGSDVLGDSEWEVEAHLRECEWWPDDPSFVGEGTVTITDDPVRLIGNAFVELEDAEEQELAPMVKGVILFLADSFSRSSSLGTSSSDFRTLAIPEGNIIEMEYIDYPKLRVDYDITFHDFDPSDPEGTARTRAELIFTWRFLSSDMQMSFAVEVAAETLQPNHVVFVAIIDDEAPGYAHDTGGELTVSCIRKSVE